MTVWLVDARWVFRFPRREMVIRGLVNEIAYLPELAALMPLPIPNPTYFGDRLPSTTGRSMVRPSFRAASSRRRRWTTADVPLSPAQWASSCERFTARSWVPISRSTRSGGRTCLSGAEDARAAGRAGAARLWHAPREAHEAIEAAVELGPPDDRKGFREAYGAITDDQLLRARILSLFLCGTLALYGHHEGMSRLRREALVGLD